MDWTLTDNVRAQDVHFIPMGVAGTRRGPELVFAWIKECFDAICTKIPFEGIIFQSIIRISGAGFTTESEALALESFWSGKSGYEAIKRTVSQVVEGIRSRSKFGEMVLASELASEEYWSQQSHNF